MASSAPYLLGANKSHLFLISNGHLFTQWLNIGIFITSTKRNISVIDGWERSSFHGTVVLNSYTISLLLSYHRFFSTKTSGPYRDWIQGAVHFMMLSHRAHVKNLNSLDSTAVAPLLTLPVELLQVIAQEMIDNYLDVLCLALTCIAMWEITERARYLSYLAELQSQNWAGSRMICFGDHALSLPKGLLTLDDRERFKEVMGEYWWGDLADENDEDSRDLAIIRRARHTFSTPRKWSLYRSDDTHGLDAPEEIEREIYTSLGGKKAAMCWTDIRKWLVLQPPEDRWMLRNLSKQEFVLKSKGSDPSSLVQALRSLICWSTDPDVSMDCDQSIAETLVCGPWAGDRIDITLFSLHNEQQRNNGDWHDITARVAELLEKLASTERSGRGFQFDP